MKKWVWRISELSPNSKNMRAQLFKKICVQPLKKSCARIFFWVWKDFGDSPKSFFPFLFLFWKNDIKQRFLCEFGESPLAPNSYVFSVSLEKRNEFGVSLEILQTLPKLAPSSYFFYISSFFGEKRNEFGVSLEIFQTLSKLISNPLQTQMISFFRVFFLYCFFPCLFERFRSGFGDYPNSLQARSKLICFHFFCCYFLFYILFWTRGMSLEILQTLSKPSPKLIF